MRGVVDVTPDAARGDAHRACRGIDADPSHRRQVDDDPAVAGAEAAAVVAAAANRGQQLLVRA